MIAILECEFDLHWNLGDPVDVYLYVCYPALIFVCANVRLSVYFVLLCSMFVCVCLVCEH